MQEKSANHKSSLAVFVARILMIAMRSAVYHVDIIIIVHVFENGY